MTLEVVLGMVVLSVLALSVLSWVSAITATAAGVTVLPWTPRRMVPWGLFDLLLIVVIFLLFTAAAVLLLLPNFRRGAELTVAQAQALLWGDALAKTAVMAVSIAYLVLLRRVNRRDQGWTIGPGGRFVPLGFATFVMIAPIVFALQAALVQLGGWESKHPLIELVKEQKSVPIFAAAFLATVIVAPLTEEWLFRVVLQGWLEKCFSGRATTESILGLPEPPVVAAELADASPATSPPPPPADEVAPPCLSSAIPPILISALLFAAVHLSHGPDFIPLFVFAVGLGVVYQRTHSIIPSLIVHACLNLTSMLALAAQVFK